MFSGIIASVVPVVRMESVDLGVRFELKNTFGVLDLGESIAVNGACLTVERFSTGDQAQMAFFVSAETLRRTNLGGLSVGARVNLERALQMSSRLSGHLVQGHVDGLASVVSLSQEGTAWRLEVEVPQSLGRYCVEKGSICLDGISLTINQVLSSNRLWVQVIPHTWENTNLRDKRVGDVLNLEVDILAKYVEALCRPHLDR